MAKHDICFVGLKCYDLLVGTEVPRYLGGIEKLLVSMARGLSHTGKNVAFITYDHGQPSEEVVDGVTIYNSFSTEEGLPGLRFFHPRMTKLWMAMRKADSAIYLQMGSGSETGRVALGCRYFLPTRRPFMFSLASDNDCNATAIHNLPARERLLYLYGVKSADILISQTVKQRKALKNTLGFDSVVLPMPIEAPTQVVNLANKANKRLGQHHILWVGRIIETKRLEFLFEVAKKCPDVIFDVVGTPNESSEYFEKLTHQAKSIPNVILHGRVAEGVLPQLYQNATLLSCTSILEGFPTVFLEAWSYGVPVVTTFDPDGIVAGNELGDVVDCVDDMVAIIQGVIASKDDWFSAAQIVLDYFNSHYTLDSILPKFNLHCADLLEFPSAFSEK